MWHKDWPHKIYVGQWPIFCGPLTLLNTCILKTIWLRNVILVILDQCDTKMEHIEIYTLNKCYNRSLLKLHFPVEVRQHQNEKCQMPSDKEFISTLTRVRARIFFFFFHHHIRLFDIFVPISLNLGHFSGVRIYRNFTVKHLTWHTAKPAGSCAPSKDFSESSAGTQWVASPRIQGVFMQTVKTDQTEQADLSLCCMHI